MTKVPAKKLEYSHEISEKPNGHSCHCTCGWGYAVDPPMRIPEAVQVLRAAAQQHLYEADPRRPKP